MSEIRWRVLRVEGSEKQHEWQRERDDVQGTRIAVGNVTTREVYYGPTEPQVPGTVKFVSREEFIDMLSNMQGHTIHATDPCRSCVLCLREALGVAEQKLKDRPVVASSICYWPSDGKIEQLEDKLKDMTCQRDEALLLMNKLRNERDSLRLKCETLLAKQTFVAGPFADLPPFPWKAGYVIPFASPEARLTKLEGTVGKIVKGLRAFHQGWNL